MICFSPVNIEKLIEKNINIEEYMNEDINSTFILGATEGEKILGLCFYEIEDKICKIKYVKMLDDIQLIKDGLIRSLINSMDLKGVEYILVKNEGEQSFYCKIGFNPLFFRHFKIDLKGEESKYMILDIKEFFEKGCCSSGKR